MNTATLRPGFAPEEIDLSASTREVPYKWVVVVDHDLPAGRAVNAAVCVASATTDRTRGILGPDTLDADGTVHPGMPWIGCTVLGAESSRLTDIRQRATTSTDVLVVDMPTPAQHTRVYDDYLLAVASKPVAEMSYYAVSLFGPRKSVDKLVKGLALLA